MELFISRSGADAEFGAEVARILETAGYSVILQQWDFANRNFMERMHTALSEGARVVALLSPEYLRSEHCQAEWQNAIAHDPLNKNGRLVLLRVVECEPPGLLSGLAYWDLVPVRDSRPLLQEIVNNAVRDERRDDPSSAPYFRSPRTILDAEAIRPTPGFTGRDDELTELTMALEERDTAVLHGLGGTGKSSLAREYAWQQRERYSVVWWLPAQQEDGIVSGLLRLGGLFVRGLDEMADRVAAAQQVTTSVLAGFNKPVLLVFDNLENERLLHAWRPRGGAKVLVTSRSASWGSDVARIGLQTWDVREAAAYLRRESGRENLSHADALALVDALGGLPLALSHAAAYLRATRTASPERYLAHVAQHMARTPPNADYPRSVFATFQAAIAAAEEQSPGAAALLCFAAQFAPDAIPDELFRQSPELYPQTVQPQLTDGPGALDLHAAVSDEIALDDALGALDRLSLVSYAQASTAFSLHRLVRLAARDLVSGAAAGWNASAIAVLDTLFPETPADFATWECCVRLLPHATRVLADAAADGTVDLRWAHLATSCGAYLSERAAFAQAEPLLTKALKVREAALGANHPDVAQTLFHLAMLHSHQGLYEQAAAEARRALEVRLEAYGDGDRRDLAESLDNLALLEAYRARYDEAVQLHLRALAMRERLEGSDGLGTAETALNLGSTYLSLGRNEEAEQLFRRSIEIREKTLGADHPQVGQSLRALAVPLSRSKRYAQAEDAARRASEILERCVGPAHPDMAIVLSTLARTVTAQGRYSEAEAILRRCLALQEAVLATDHPEIGAILDYLSEACRLQEHYDDAQTFAARAVRVHEASVGPLHRYTGRSVYFLAQVYRDRGRHEEALAELERALTILEGVVGPDHADTVAVRNALAELRSSV